MSDREPGVFYILHLKEVKDTDPSSWHLQLCIEYFRDYGEILEATFCHDIHKDYEYEEMICEHTTWLESNIAPQKTIQLQWDNSADISQIRGYHVFRNDTRITDTLLTEPVYLDENLPNGNYEYYVRTYYKEGCVSDMSNKVAETIGVGVREIEEKDIALFPNPTTGELRVTSYKLRINDIDVFDVFGRKIFSSQSPLSTEHTLDISHFNAGIYFVRVTTEKGVVTKKVVKY